MQTREFVSVRLIKSLYLMLVTCASFIFAGSSIVPKAHAYCLSIASNPKKLKLVAAIQEDVKKIFVRADICASYVNLPLKRMQINMKRGEIDGEFLRIQKYINAMKKHVVKVPTPIISVTGVLVTLSSSSLKPKKLSDIKNHYVGIMHGTVWQRNAVKGNRNISKGYSYKDLAEKLKEGEIETFLIEELALATLVKNGVLQASQIYVSPVVVDHPTYLLMHRKHKHLVGKLDATLKALKAEGAFQIEKCCK